MDARYMSRLLILWMLLIGTGPAFSSVGVFERWADWGGPDLPPQRGDFKVAGSAFLQDGHYVVQGNGDDIWDESDEGYFIFSERSAVNPSSGG